ncbi:MAG: hypothetical protein ACMXYC_02900 [Candidatus Woesearchaeota archaeon]
MQEIKLSGLKDLPRNDQFVIKKMIGDFLNHRKIDTYEQFDIHHKLVHNSVHELTAHLHKSGKVTTAKTENHNVFIGVDDVLKKIAEQL